MLLKLLKLRRLLMDQTRSAPGPAQSPDRGHDKSQGCGYAAFSASLFLLR
jgi:hypothetical protein